MGNPKNYRLSPSDLTFLYDKCKHCFVLRVKHGIGQPSIPLPAIFTRIASLQKDYFSGKRTEELSPGLPPGIVRYGEKRVRSRELELPGCTSTCHLAGRFDIVAELDDGSFAILDFKTSSPSDEKSDMYARQLQAYAVALENPEPGELHLSPVSMLGLLYFTPDRYSQSEESRQNLSGELQLAPIERDEARFVAFLSEVVSVLDGPTPPPGTDACDWCAFRAQTSKFLTGEGASAGDAARGAATPSCPKCQGPMQLKKGKFGEFWSCVSFPSCRGTRNP